MKEKIVKEKIKKSLNNFANKNYYLNAVHLFETLGYKSDLKVKFGNDSVNEFMNIYIEDNSNFRKEKALFDKWKEVPLLFQITQNELSVSDQIAIFKVNEFDRNEYMSYAFLFIELQKGNYTRGNLSTITREINKNFKMPIMILFKVNNKLTFSIINRRPNKVQKDKDVLEKVTLIKDIDIKNPHRAHIEILYDLSLEKLAEENNIKNFLDLHNAWQKVLDISKLNKKFYLEISNWYYWALSEVSFPKIEENTIEDSNSKGLIRLLTRLIFVWFIKEKKLIPNILFKKNEIEEYLNSIDKTDSTYYKAILQNLFFATLNLKMKKDKSNERIFVRRGKDDFHSQQNMMPAYRYKRFFKDSKKAIKLFEGIPFLNGGLFENLDYEKVEKGKRYEIRIDCFSDQKKNEDKLKVPDKLFFGEERKVDISKAYNNDEKKKDVKTQGIIHILKKYKFTIEENTPIEEEIALDPELLGKVFENLLASYNPETKTTARKSTGSYYTPREIVNYMVDESIISYLENILVKPYEKQTKFDIVAQPSKTGIFGKSNSQKIKLSNKNIKFSERRKNEINRKLHDLLSYNDSQHLFNKQEVDILIKAIDNIKILDPACGSGAFPMGILQKLVFILGKVDKDNELWEKRQIKKVENAITTAQEIDDSKIRRDTIKGLNEKIDDIKDAFKYNELDYGRKLYLIENCIHGVDIQEIAIQISKLRFFISLVIDQDKNVNKKNLGIRALPNLETKFVSANTLIGLEKPTQIPIRNLKIDKKEKDLIKIRHKYFSAITRTEKRRYKEDDKKLRNEISDLLIGDGWNDKTAHKIANWNPYNKNLVSDWFDIKWMFGVEDGFDIVIGNPPYIESRSPNFSDKMKTTYQNAMKQRNPKELSKLITRGADLLVYFFERSISLVNKVGFITMITQNSWLDTDFGRKFQHYLLKSTHVEVVIDSDYKHFYSQDGPNINTVIVIFQGNKDLGKNTYFAKYHKPFSEVTLGYNSVSLNKSIANIYKINPRMSPYCNYKWGQYFYFDSVIINLLAKMKIKGMKLKQMNFSVGQGLNLRKEFIIPTSKIKAYSNERISPILTSKDDSPFIIEKTKNYCRILTPTKKEPPVLILPRGIGRHFCGLNKVKAYSSSFVDIYADKSYNQTQILNLWLFMNSSVFWLLREIKGRKNLGGGMLKAEATDIKDLYLYYSFENEENIQLILKSIGKRRTLPTLFEIETEEHKFIDEIVFDHLAIPKEQRNDIIVKLKDIIDFRQSKSKKT